MLSPVNALPPGSVGNHSLDSTALREVAIQLEATFLAEMLKSAGVGKTPEGFGGGAGEDQFGSFLVQAQAEQMARSETLGIARMVLESLMEKTDV
jgi:Rod binding domain-containing protein